MKLTDVHANLHLTTTALQFAFRLHSVSVSYLCYILWYKHLYDCSHCAKPIPNKMKLTANGPTSHHPLTGSKLNDTMEKVACGVTSGVFLRYCSWNDSVTVQTANGWQSKALAVGNFYHIDGITQWVTSCPTHHGGSRHIPELRHRIRHDGLAI